MVFEPLSAREEEIATKIVDAAYTVHKTLGPGLLEKVYETCLCHKLKKCGLNFKRQLIFLLNMMDWSLTKACELMCL